jgi:hypothetical protein
MFFMVNYSVNAVGTKRSLTKRGGTMSQGGKYKNWLAICSVEDFYLRMALAMADLNTREGALLSERLSMYFSSQSAIGPFPLSYLIRLWELAIAKNPLQKGFYKICEQVGIPVFRYSKFPTKKGDVFMPFEFEEFVLEGSMADNPNELLARRKDFVFRHKKKKFFIVCSEISAGEVGYEVGPEADYKANPEGSESMVLYFVPLGCIIIDK